MSGNQLDISVATTDSPFVGPNERRHALILSVPPTNRYTLSFQGVAVLDQGLNIQPGTDTIILTENEFG